MYADEHPLSVPGVGCQTETAELEPLPESEHKPDLKLKIALVSKRKRGRPVKAQPRKRISAENVPVSRYLMVYSIQVDPVTSLLYQKMPISVAY